MIRLSGNLRAIFCVCVVVLVCGFARAELPLTSIKAIKALSAAEAGQAQPLVVEGVIVWTNPFQCTFFMYNDGQGVFVRSVGPGSDPAWYQAGARVRVTGETREGSFSPIIAMTSIELIGQEAVPKARPFLAYQTYSTEIDCDWVRLSGRIQSMHISNKERDPCVILEVESRDLLQKVLVPLTEGTQEKIQDLMFRRVIFNAVAGTQSNRKRQALGRIFYVNSPEEFDAIDKHEPVDGTKLKTISELMQRGEEPRVPVRIRGVVTHVDGRALYLRGENSSIKATLRKEMAVAIGQYVELQGFVLLGLISPAFLARSIEVIDTEPRPEPLEMNESIWKKWEYQPDAELNYELVQVDAVLVDISDTLERFGGPKEQRLLCRHAQHVFSVKLPPDSLGNKELELGETLRITGICNLIRSESLGWRLHVDGFWIQLRSLDDLVVLRTVPWWNTKRLFGALGILGGVLSLVLIWVVVLRRTVEKQTSVIATQVERESVHNERQRIARELHDNLAQGLAGMAIQLRATQRGLELNKEKWLGLIRAIQSRFGARNEALMDDLETFGTQLGQGVDRDRQAVEVVQGMLVHCSQESRASIQDLRGGILERKELAAAMQETLQPLADECGATLEIKVEGPVLKLVQSAERHLLLIVKEAATNISHHAAATSIRVQLTYTDSGLYIRISDNGHGCEINDLSKAGHFGIQGMHERVNQLNGTVLIESHLGVGTTVLVEVPSTAEWVQG